MELFDVALGLMLATIGLAATTLAISYWAGSGFEDDVTLAVVDVA